MRRSILLLMILSMMLFVSAAYAAAPEDYIVFKTGIYTPTSDDLTSEENGANFGTGFDGEIAVGHYFKQNVAGEISAGYAETTSNFHGFDAKIWTFPVLVTFKFFYPLNEIQPYAEAGGGYYYAHLNTHGDDYHSDGWGTHLGLGVDYNLTKDAFVGLEGRYIWAFYDFNDPGSSKINGHGYTLTVDLGYRY